MWISAGRLPVAHNCCCLIKSHTFASCYQMTVLQLAAQPEQSRELIIWEDVWFEELIDKTWPHMVSSPLLQYGWPSQSEGVIHYAHFSASKRVTVTICPLFLLSFSFSFSFFFFLTRNAAWNHVSIQNTISVLFCFVLFKFSYWPRYSRQVSKVSPLWICWKPHRWWRLLDCLCVAQLAQLIPSFVPLSCYQHKQNCLWTFRHTVCVT